MKHLLIILFALLILTPVMSQDATPQATQEATSEAPIVINIEQPAAPVPASDTSPTGIIVLVLGFAATVMIAISLGLQVIGNRAKQISDNPVAVAALEQTYGSLPDAIKAATQPITESLERSDAALKQVIALVNKLTDGVPEADKPAAPVVGVNTTPDMFTSTGVPPLS